MAEVLDLLEGYQPTATPADPAMDEVASGDDSGAA